ncbi:MAG: hypothetical protein LH479_09095 [Polaromonas sp.]|nr:hypothetical protein [Polaromonas sp.]
MRLFLRTVLVHQAFPFELKEPDAERRAALEEPGAMMASRLQRAPFCRPVS